MFTSLEMLYSYGQPELLPDTAMHSKYQIKSQKATETYTFNRYYGLTKLPPEFQKSINRILHNIRKTFAFIDNILIVIKDS